MLVKCLLKESKIKILPTFHRNPNLPLYQLLFVVGSTDLNYDREQRVLFNSQSKQTSDGPGRRELFLKIISLVLKGLKQSRIVLAASPARIHILGLSKCQ